jgi:polyhydroxyalkanoate synthase subunit PhaC
MLQRAENYTRFLASDPVAKAKIGQSPNRIIHHDRKAVVRLFAPAEVKHKPVFVSMPLINTWTIFDLLPGRSVVEALNKAGVPVYLLDWGRPGPEDSLINLELLIDGTLRRSMDRTRRDAKTRYGADSVDAIGYCVGGTYLTIMLARYPDMARRLALLATPIDFHASGRLSLWANPETFPLDEVIDGHGNFPAEMMKQSFAWLRPMGQIAKWKSLWDKSENADFRTLWAAMEAWNNDNTDFAGAAYREYVRRCYFDNALMVGGWKLGGETVDLSKGKAPALVLAASDDHIVPPVAAFALKDRWGAPVTTRTLRGGHVGVCVGKELPAALLEWIRA